MKNGKSANQKITLKNKYGPPKKWVNPRSQIITIVIKDPEIFINYFFFKILNNSSLNFFTEASS
jgi:hypothetical protein